MTSNNYQRINNIGGWIVFAIALCTYWLTLEPTASYWDCGEFIIQADKLEVGHPPGNPIFMLTARFFANFASSPETISVMVNAMSGLLSALTILLLFWTITHLVKRLVVRDGSDTISLRQYLAIIGSGAVGALAYCWSDTFWFSAVEGEVYAFSSFCTALVFWLILKWEDRADEPGADRWLILIAYVIGISVAVHLLNLLCIPAIVLVFAYRKYKDMNLLKSVIALIISFLIIFFVLYGLVPGFIKVAQQFELFFVNSCGMSFNSGALIYAFTALVVFIWTLWALYAGKNATMIRCSILVAVTLSGMLFIGSGAAIGIILTLCLAGLLFFVWRKKLPVRWLNIAMWSIAVIFVGYSSYALILIRSSAATPMNQNAPDNVFDLASYLNREQYGEAPLIYGRTVNSQPARKITTSGYLSHIRSNGKALYAKGLKGALPNGLGTLNESEMNRNAELEKRGSDYYAKKGYDPEVKYNPELNMLFPRIYSPLHSSMYGEWVALDTLPENLVAINVYDEATGQWIPEEDYSQAPRENPLTGVPVYPQKMAYKPTFSQNLAYFFNYQLNHMYMRYFMWNFAGRQNDLLNQHGELDLGNWVSGIPAIDNPRLGDQSLLPDNLGKNNKGHNVYYMLPLLLGIIGLLWQAFAGRRGIEQFWVVFFLFFMTGIAIVLYLNQPPGQPRERDYAFAGSFYAFAIWIGMGVVGLWRIILFFVNRKNRRVLSDDIQPLAIIDESDSVARKSLICVAIACAFGLAVPLQMVSQTWDDHDRSGRYAARDYGANYLESLEPNAIVFCNGDNDTFPLWYAQEVEGVRPDVKIINLSYLASDWYANQQRMQSYEAAPVKFTAKPSDYAYNHLDGVLAVAKGEPQNLLDALKKIYNAKNDEEKVIEAQYLYIPVDKAAVIKRGLVAPEDTAAIEDKIVIDLANAPGVRSKGYVSLSDLLMLDIIATNAANGWERPIYWAMTVGPEYHLGLTPYVRSTGMTHQLVPTIQNDMAARNDRAFDVVTKKYRWGGADAPADKAPYFDETAARMLASVRSSMLGVATECLIQGEIANDKGDKAAATKEYKRGVTVLDLMRSKLKDSTMAPNLSLSLDMAHLYCELGAKNRLNDSKVTQTGLAILRNLLEVYGQYIVYNQHMAATFIRPSLSYESQLIPYQYYNIIEYYTKYGGDMAVVEKKLKQLGITLEILKRNYDAYNNTFASGGADAESADSDLDALMGYIKTVVRLQSLSPEEYAKTSEQDRQTDSIFYFVLEEPDIVIGGQKLSENEDFKKIDKARSKALFDKFVANHPEILQQ